MKIERGISCSVLKGRGQQGLWCNFCVCAVADLYSFGLGQCFDVGLWAGLYGCCTLNCVVLLCIWNEILSFIINIKIKEQNLCTNPHKWYFLYISKYLKKTLPSTFNSVKVNARALIMQYCCTSWSQIVYPTISRFMWTTCYLWPECIWITL